MKELLTLGKKLMKTITRVDSVLQAIDKEDMVRTTSRGLSLIDDIWEIGKDLLKLKEET